MTQTGSVAEGRLSDWISLGVLASWVPRDAVDEAVEATGKGAKRKGGKLPPHVMVYFAMALALFAGEDYEETWVRLSETLADWGCWDPAAHQHAPRAQLPPRGQARPPQPLPGQETRPARYPPRRPRHHPTRQPHPDQGKDQNRSMIKNKLSLPHPRGCVEAYRFRRHLYYVTCAILVSTPSSYSEGVRYPSPF